MVEQQKEDSYVPVTTMSSPGREHHIHWWHNLNALDWACGLGMADCGPIQSGGACFDPDTLLSHASYAFNNYYQQNGNNDIACNFGGTATVTNHDPSYGKCSFTTSGSVSSAPRGLGHDRRNLVWWKFSTLLLLLYLGS
ncbi:hypothetical protein Ancab_019087 [Ancistrocladus abbreviatus]